MCLCVLVGRSCTYEPRTLVPEGCTPNLFLSHVLCSCSLVLWRCTSGTSLIGEPRVLETVISTRGSLPRCLSRLELVLSGILWKLYSRYSVWLCSSYSGSSGRDTRGESCFRYQCHRVTTLGWRSRLMVCTYVWAYFLVVGIL